MGKGSDWRFRNAEFGLGRDSSSKLGGGSDATLCIFLFVLLGSFEKDGQAGVIRPVATGRMTVRVGTFALGIRFDVMRPVACFTRAHCPELEPLFEHDNSKIIVARIPQV